MEFAKKNFSTLQLLCLNQFEFATSSKLVGSLFFSSSSEKNMFLIEDPFVLLENQSVSKSVNRRCQKGVRVKQHWTRFRLKFFFW